MFSSLNSFALLGVDALPINVEASISRGMPMFDIVGLPDTAVKESRERVKAAIKNAGFEFPIGSIIINLAPADIRKEGAIYDLPIFLSILNISGKFDFNFNDSAFAGELSLSGELRPIKGILPMCIKAKELKIKTMYVPKENAFEGSVVSGINVIPVSHVKELISHLNGDIELKPALFSPDNNRNQFSVLDFSEVKGQESAKRAIEVAVAGGHNILMIGPPGSGKSMLAKRIPTILPYMSFDEMIETTKIYSIAGKLKNGVSLIESRPFRSPHHNVSPSGLTGGGSIPKPGEISLAHNGVLFLDELPEFGRNTMEALRQPIEDSVVTISRVNCSLTYPCSVMVVAAMNPCPCGYFGHPARKCTCTNSAVSKYLSKVSGPLLDRFDLHIEVPPVEFKDLESQTIAESSVNISKRVARARKIQMERFNGMGACFNSKMASKDLKSSCVITESAKTTLRLAFEKLGMSARTHDKILKVSRTIADLDNCELIDSKHVMEAIQYRALDKKYWSHKQS